MNPFLRVMGPNYYDQLIRQGKIIMQSGRVEAFVLSGVAALALSVSPVMAGDAAATSDWQGFYLGLALGGAHSAAKSDTGVVYGTGYFNDAGGASDRDQINPILQRRIDGQDLTGSVLAGYDFQSGNITYGLEGDLTFMGFSQTQSAGPVNYDTAPASTFTTRTTIESDFLLSLRPKLGYVSGPFQFYVSAGPSVSRFKMTHQYSDTHNGGSSVTFSDSKTALGVSSSIGVGYMLSDGWVLRSDYVFSYYPDITGGSSELNGDGKTDFTYGSDFQSHNLRLALIKRF
ncbi:outer membrane protein [Hoeflea sp.]|uniref:outer membrane protein n=1 Tax=Hoeflea sp. TaxID=1940281 RepID=UPI003A919DCA